MAIRASGLALGTILAMAVGQPAAAQGFVYPAQGQTPEQQATDEAECSAWASQQTGINPSQQAPQVGGSGGSTGGEVVGGAARGAALGAIGGLIGGSAGTGAAIGAGVGATAGLFNRVGQERQQQQAQQQANAQHQAQLQEYYRARAACLTGRGYTVN
jgi:hypothetical protein